MNQPMTMSKDGERVLKKAVNHGEVKFFWSDKRGFCVTFSKHATNIKGFKLGERMAFELEELSDREAELLEVGTKMVYTEELVDKECGTRFYRSSIRIDRGAL